MKLNLNINVKDIYGKEIDNAGVKVNAGKVIAEALVNTPKGDVLKHYEWAQKLAKGQPLELDKSDTEYLKKFIENNDNFFIILKAQALEAFEKAKP
jgi:hypothetical protein